MNYIALIWNLLNGKKTVIGISLIIALHGINYFFPTFIPPELNTEIENGLLLLTGGVGLGHKIIKNAKNN